MCAGVAPFAERSANTPFLWNVMKSTGLPLGLLPTTSSSPLPRPLGCVFDVIETPPDPPAAWLSVKNTDNEPTLTEHVVLAVFPEPNLLILPGVAAPEPRIVGCAFASNMHGLGNDVAAAAGKATRRTRPTTPTTTRPARGRMECSATLTPRDNRPRVGRSQALRRGLARQRSSSVPPGEPSPY